MAKTKILVFEDDPAISGIIEHELKGAGCNIISVSDGDKGLALAKSKRPDLIVLDVMLSSADGFEICKKLRLDEATKYLPVIILGAETQDEEKIVGQEFDVDDYVATPFRPGELIARIKAVMRRMGLAEGIDELEEAGGVYIDDEEHEDE